MTAVKRPAAGTLAANVCNFFAANRDECLTEEDIAIKFDFEISDIAKELRLPVRQKLLAMMKAGKRGVEYSAGDALAQAVPRRAIPKPPAGGGARNMPKIDIKKLRVEHGVPTQSNAGRGTSRYDYLFELLTKPDQSIELPIEFQETVNSAARKYSAKHPPINLRARKASPTTCRLFRIA